MSGTSDRDGQARRHRRCLWEMWLVLAVWFAAGLYSLPVSFWLSGQDGGGGVNCPLNSGIPAWVFWGVVVPWAVCNLVTVWLCFFVFEDVPLAELDSLSESGSQPAPEARQVEQGRRDRDGT